MLLTVLFGYYSTSSAVWNDFMKVGSMFKTLLGESQRFGVGNPAHELKSCSHIHVFMTCSGHSNLDKRRACFEANTTLLQVKTSFDQRVIGQELIFDENYYRFHDADMEKPLWLFSSQCRLNILFVYENHMKRMTDNLHSKLHAIEL